MHLFFKPKTLKPLQILTQKHLIKPQTSPLIFLHNHNIHTSLFKTPEEATTYRRNRKHLLRVTEPSLKAQTYPKPNPTKPPEHISLLSGPKLNLHNKILKLLRDDDVTEADLYTRHSIYSNVKPTMFTCNAVMEALFTRGRSKDLLDHYYFAIQAGYSPNIVTYNLVLSVWFKRGMWETGVEVYKFVLRNAPFRVGVGTYRIIVKGLVECGKLERAVEIRDEMVVEKGFEVDEVVYSYLILGYGGRGDWEGALSVFNELKEKLGIVEDGVVYASLMKVCFDNGMVDEGRKWYNVALGEGESEDESSKGRIGSSVGDKDVDEGEKAVIEASDSEGGEGDGQKVPKVVIGTVGYNLMLEAFVKNGRFEEGLKLFDRMLEEHNRPTRLCVDIQSFRLIVDEYCRQGKLKEAVNVFGMMRDKRCVRDTALFNMLMTKLCANDMEAVAEVLFKEMGDKFPNKPDDFTYTLLVETCFEKNRVDDAHWYFTKMVESGLKPNLTLFVKMIDFDRVINDLMKSEKIEHGQMLFALTLEQLNPDLGSYKAMLILLCEAGLRVDILKIVGDMLKNKELRLSSEMQEVVIHAFKKVGKEEELRKFCEEKERERAKALQPKLKKFDFTELSKISFNNEEFRKVIPEEEEPPVQVEELLGNLCQAAPIPDKN